MLSDNVYGFVGRATALTDCDPTYDSTTTHPQQASISNSELTIRGVLLGAITTAWAHRSVHLLRKWPRSFFSFASLGSGLLSASPPPVDSLGGLYESTPRAVCDVLTGYDLPWIDGDAFNQWCRPMAQGRQRHAHGPHRSSTGHIDFGRCPCPSLGARRPSGPGAGK